MLDAGTGQELALMEAAAEFLERYRCKHSQAEGEQPRVCARVGFCIQILCTRYIRYKRMGISGVHEQSCVTFKTRLRFTIAGTGGS